MVTPAQPNVHHCARFRTLYCAQLSLIEALALQVVEALLLHYYFSRGAKVFSYEKVFKPKGFTRLLKCESDKWTLRSIVSRETNLCTYKVRTQI